MQNPEKKAAIVDTTITGQGLFAALRILANEHYLAVVFEDYRVAATHNHTNEELILILTSILRSKKDATCQSGRSNTEHLQ